MMPRAGSSRADYGVVIVPDDLPEFLHSLPRNAPIGFGQRPSVARSPPLKQRLLRCAGVAAPLGPAAVWRRAPPSSPDGARTLSRIRWGSRVKSCFARKT